MASNSALFASAQKAAYLGDALSQDQIIDIICQDEPIDNAELRYAMESSEFFPLISQLAGKYIAKGWEEGSNAKGCKEGSKAWALKAWIKEQL